VKAVGRVGNALAVHHAQVVVDLDQVAGRDFIEAQAQLLRVKRTVLTATAADLPCQAGIMPAIEQDAAGQRQGLPRRPRAVLRDAGQAPLGDGHQCVFRQGQAGARGGRLHTEYFAASSFLHSC